MLNEETDFEINSEKTSEKIFFITKIWAIKLFQNSSFPELRIVGTPKKITLIEYHMGPSIQEWAR